MTGHKIRAGEKIKGICKAVLNGAKRGRNPCPKCFAQEFAQFFNPNKDKDELIFIWHFPFSSTNTPQVLNLGQRADKSSAFGRLLERTTPQVRLQMCIHSSRCHCSLSCSWRQGIMNSSRTASLIFTCVWGTQATLSPFHPHSKADLQQMKCYITLFCEELLRITLLSTEIKERYILWQGNKTEPCTYHVPEQGKGLQNKGFLWKPRHLL